MSKHRPARSPLGTNDRRLHERRGKSPGDRRRACRPRLQSLEGRILLSAFYDLTTIATTAGGSFTRFGDLVSSNSIGEVAFVGSTTASPFGGDGLYVKKAGTFAQPVNINPTFSGHDDRSFGRTAAINDQDIVSARDQVATSTPQFFVRRWSSRTADANIILSGVPTNDPSSPDRQLSSLGGYTDIDQAGDIVFVSASADSAYRSVQYVSHNNLGLDTYKTLETMPGGAKTSPRPQLTDLGQVLYYSTDANAIKLVDTTTTRATVIASAGVGGFRSLGPAPGVSSDGQVVVFEGDRGQGPGIFAAYKTGGKFQVVRIAGERLDGFVAFDTTSAVQVGGGSIGVDARGVTIAFVGTRIGHGTGLYSARLSFFGRSESDYDPTQVQSTLVSGVAPVLESLDILPDGKRLDLVKFWHGIDQVHRGRLSFWVQATDGTQEILQADPKQVVLLQFAPSGAKLSGRSAATVRLLQNDVGIDDFGDTGTAKDALAQVGLPMSDTAYDALQTDVVNAVQKAFSDIGTRVSVFGLPGQAPPAYVPEPVLDASGQVVRADGSAVLSGVYKTIFVGFVPTGGKGFLGIASEPPAATRTYLDFYNQVMDSTAFVFVNQIFNPNFFAGTPIATLEHAEQVRAISATITHETGHLLGLYHLDGTIKSEIMHAATVVGEFDKVENFGVPPQPVQQNDGGTLSGVSESSAGRLHYSLNEASGTAPNPALFQVKDANVKAKLGLPTTTSLTVKHLLVGVKSSGGDTAPVFTDLGGGDLATLLNDANILVAPGNSLLVVGSTDGVKPDVIAVAQGQEGAQNSLSLSVLGLMGDSRLAAPVSGAGAGLHFFRLTAAGPVDLGLAPIATTPINHAPTLALLDNQVVSVGTTVRFTAAATDPDAGQTLTYSLDAGAPLGATIDPLTGVFTWTPTAVQGGQIDAITVSATDSGTPAQSASQTITINVSNRLQVLGVTYLSAPRPGPLRVAVDFNQALQPVSAQTTSLYKIISDGGLALPIQSATYSDAGTQHRVVLTVAAGTLVVPDVYHVSVDGAGLVATSGDRGAPKADQLWTEVVAENALKPIEVQADGTFVAGDGFNLGHDAPKQVLSGDFTGDGVADLVVRSDAFFNDYSQGIAVYEPVMLMVGHGDGTFSPPMPIAGGGGFHAEILFSADWNHDGQSDLILGGYHSLTPDNRILQVLLNDGHGHFADAPDTPIPLPPSSDGTYSPFSVVGAADLDGNGTSSLVLNHPVAANGQSTLGIVAKDPFVGYSTQAVVATGESGSLVSPAEVVFSDLNGDGKLDIIVRHYGYYAKNPGITVNLSTPTGFAPGQKVLTPAGLPITVGAGDFTGDGKRDIVTVYDNYRNDIGDGVYDGDVIVIDQGDGRGGFAPQPPILLNHRDVALAVVGDVNNDGLPDLVMIDTASTGSFPGNTFDFVTQLSAWTWLADGRGGFRPSTPAPIALAASDQGTPTSISLADVDHDGFLDLVLGGDTAGEVRLAINDGAGAMRPPSVPLPNLGAGHRLQPELDLGEPREVFGDFNNDGLRDVVTTGNGHVLQVYLGTRDGGFVPTSAVPSLTPGDTIGWLKSGDVNNDGIPDLVFGSSGGTRMATYLGNGDGTFRQASPVLTEVTGNYITNTALADLNGDGKLDAMVSIVLASGDTVSASLGVCFGDGTGKFTFNLNTVIPIGLPYPGFRSEFTAPLGDFDGDGKLDVLVSTTSVSDGRQTLTLYRGKGNGTFTAGPVVYAGVDFSMVDFLIRDFNGDGKLDFLGYTSGQSSAYLYLGNGRGTFSPVPDLNLNIEITDGSHSGGPVMLTAGDFDGDGKLDLAAGYFYKYSSSPYVSANQVYLYAGDGTGHFAGPQYVTTGANPVGLVSIPRPSRLEAGTFAVTDRAPTPVDDTAQVIAGTSVEIPVLANDTDPDRESLSVTGVSTPAHGVAHVVLLTPGVPSSAAIRYTPAVGFIGADRFTYTVADAAGVEASANVTVTVLDSTTPRVVAVTRLDGAPAGHLRVAIDYSSAIDPVAAANAAQYTIGVPGRVGLVVLSASYSDANGVHRATVEAATANGGPLPGGSYDVRTDGSRMVLAGSVAVVGQSAFQFSAATYSAVEAGGPATITLTRTGDLGLAAGITYATGGGTATAGLDYTSTTGTLAFAPGVASLAFTVPILDDRLIEGNETIGLTLSAPTGAGSGLGAASQATLTILDDDLPAAQFGKLGFAAAAVTVLEGKSVVLAISRTEGISGTVSVHYALGGGTALPGRDYTSASGDLTFAAGVLSQTITVAAPQNAAKTGSLTVFVTLSAPSGGATLGTTSQATVTILDDDKFSPLSDFDGDGKSDLGVFGPYGPGGAGRFLVRTSTGDAVKVSGGARDVPVVGDFDGDGKADHGAFGPDPSNPGLIRVDILLSGGGELTCDIGGPLDVPFIGDFNGDGKSDFGVFGPYGSNGQNRYVIGFTGPISGTTLNFGGALINDFGGPLDVAVVGDFNGDGKSDIGAFGPYGGDGLNRVAIGFLSGRSGDNAFIGGTGGGFGGVDDVIVVGDFNGDGISDIGAYGPYGTGGQNRIAIGYLDGKNGDVAARPRFIGGFVTDFGGTKDIVSVGDFNGDGKSDFGVYGPYGPGGANRYAVGFSNGTPTFTDGIVINFGQTADLALTGSYGRRNAKRPNS